MAFCLSRLRHRFGVTGAALDWLRSYLADRKQLVRIESDSTLSMTNHISTICRTAYMHLHNISRIRRYLTPEATKSLVHAFIMSRLDYGNALLAGLPFEHLKKLQRIQNIAARIITFTPRRDHITPILKQLHWLQTSHRI